MNKIKLLLLLTLLSVSWLAEASNISLEPLDFIPYQKYSINELDFESSAAEVEAWLMQRHDLKQQEALVLVSDRESPGGRHLFFNHQFKGLPILLSGIKVHLYKDGTGLVQYFRLNPESIELKEEYEGSHYIPKFGQLYKVNRILSTSGDKAIYEYYYGDQVLYRSEKNRYYNDTVAKAKIFRPNPILSAETVYGGFYGDNNDLNNDSLQNQLFEVEIQVRFDNDSFYLEHDSFRFAELSAPYLNDDYKSSSDSFFYDRKQDRFEAVNVYYHLSTYISYLQLIGYQGLILAFTVDVHGLGGSDQSEFDPDNYSIQFGDGGVDDAEDAEVIIHEFAHLLSETGTSYSLEGTQRSSMEEGVADYLAKSYTRTYTDYMAYDVFTWDGHNQFWDGFILNDPRKYPAELVNTRDGDREIWSTTLMCIYDYIGRGACDSLVLEMMYYWIPYQTFLDATDDLLLIDSILFHQKNSGYINECFIARGFRLRADVIHQAGDQDDIRILNSLAFSNGEGNISFEANQAYNIQIYDITGQLILEAEDCRNYTIEPERLVKGTYVAIIRTEDRYLQIKFLR